MLDIAIVHGLGGSPATMWPLAEALADAGWSVDTPLLPGHGTDPADLVGVGWADWIGAVPPAAVVVGQSLGGSLALELASRRLVSAGVVCINALGYGDPDAVRSLEEDERGGVHWVDAGAPDIRAPGIVEEAYVRLPIGALVEMTRGVTTIDLAAVTVPTLVVTSDDDAVLDPYHSDVIAAGVQGPVERLRLPRSGHVATLDLDAPMLIDATVEWVSRALSRRR